MPNDASANTETQGNKKTSKAKRSNTDDLPLLLERSQSKLYQTQMLLSVSVRKVIESYESDVIQGWPWQIEDEADVDSRKPRFL